MKNLFRKIMTMIILMVAVIAPSQAYDSFSYTVLNLPDSPRTEEPWLKVMQTQDEWETFFYATTSAITYPVGMAPIADQFDFDKYQVISGGLGVRSTGGFYLNVESVHQLDDELLIHVLDIRPGPSCVVSFATTYPSITILVKKTDKPINISVTELTHQCIEE